MLIDTHLHLLSSDYNDIDSVLNRARDNGVMYFIVGGCDKESNNENIKLISKYDYIYGTVGFHPEFASIISDNDLLEMEELIKNNRKIIGIGEIGLDYHYGKDNMKEQKELFEKQMKLAEKYNLPVVIHSRDSINDTYEILSKYKVKGIIHCYSGSYEMAKKFIDLGYYLGIGGVLTFKNSNLKDVVKKISLDNIVLETDSPYLSPIRGEVNEPKNVRLVADFLSKLKEVSVDEVESITTGNVCSLFDIEF